MMFRLLVLNSLGTEYGILTEVVRIRSGIFIYPVYLLNQVIRVEVDWPFTMMNSLRLMSTLLQSPDPEKKM